MERQVLFISPRQNDAKALRHMLSAVSLDLDHAANLAEAGSRLRQHGYGAVLTEATLPDGAWTDVLEMNYHLPAPSALIVTDTLADDRFWAEVLNRGAYDLLAQPFDETEVQRILQHACQQASSRRASAAARPRAIKAAF
jgi:DNA-binding NtrC family response regulator